MKATLDRKAVPAKLVRVEWVDAHHHAPGEWVPPGAPVPGVRVVTVGFLLSRRDGHCTVAQSVDDSGNSTGVFSIPHSAVKRFDVVARDPFGS